MPERPLTIVTYAVSASLAALLLGYVFGPTLFPDDEGYSATKKKGVVGLSNPANDCFINSILQSFVGLKSFKDYLDAECQPHLPGTADDETADDIGAESSSHRSGPIIEPASRALQDEIVTRALRVILNELSQTPAYKKTISARDFVRTLEFAFGAHISRRQQDAQEFLHIVAERLCDEFHAFHSTSDNEGENTGQETGSSQINDEQPIDTIFEKLRIEQTEETTEEKGKSAEKPFANGKSANSKSNAKQRQRFPLEGTIESQIECQTCHFKPKPSISSFVTLTLNVPQKSTTTLDACLDMLLKAESIDGYKCARCRIAHALHLTTKQLAQAQARSQAEAQRLEDQTQLLQRALEDPESPPDGTTLPDATLAPQRRITKHMRISSHPATLALHLSRSIFDAASASLKNYASVAFPETLALGVLQRTMYRLMVVVTHRGGHNSGHYETYRRQSATAPASAAVAQGMSASLQLELTDGEEEEVQKRKGDAAMQKPRRRRRQAEKSETDKADDRWWCISDDKFRACSTEDVLGMQKDAYLLYYELQPT